MSKTKIEWTEYSWNPVTGCFPVSPGCKNCYAERFALRLKEMGNKRYVDGFKVTLHEDLIRRPYEWKKSAMVFVNSMSDLFHELVPFDFIERMFKTMNECSHLTFQILTKRTDRLLEIGQRLKWTANIWMGVSVETQKYICRINDLQQIPSTVRFLSFEPLLEAIDVFPLDKIHWVIVGGESGPNARIMKREWAQYIRNQCNDKGVAFFFKQWGGVNKKKNGRLLDGVLYDQYPYQMIKENTKTMKYVQRVLI